MSVVEFLAWLRLRGVVMEPCGDRVRVDAPRGVMTEELRERIVTHKLELLAYLRTQAVGEVDVGSHSLAATLSDRVEVFRKQIARWTGREIPLLTLPDAPPPQAGRCVSCGQHIQRGWRCAPCFHAVYIALDATPPEEAEP